jgi:hypothetical protein
MSLYAILLFVHVSGAICLFTGIGIWLFGITVIARAERVEQVRAVADLMLMVRNIVPAGALLVIVAGVTMTWTAWGFQTGWIAVALGSLVIIGPIGTWVIDPRVRAIATLAHTLPDGPLPIILAERTHERVLLLALHTMTAMLFGIVFLMTTKPTLGSAIGAMLVSTLLGLVSGILLRRTQPSEEDAAMNAHSPEQRR